jgi:hypothetical protein
LINDGDVTALAGALSLEQNAMLGLAMDRAKPPDIWIGPDALPDGSTNWPLRRRSESECGRRRMVG